MNGARSEGAVRSDVHYKEASRISEATSRVPGAVGSIFLHLSLSLFVSFFHSARVGASVSLCVCVSRTKSDETKHERNRSNPPPTSNNQKKKKSKKHKTERGIEVRVVPCGPSLRLVLFFVFQTIGTTLRPSLMD